MKRFLSLLLAVALVLTLFPALSISILMIAFNLFGNGLRDALDPTQRGQE